MPTTRRRVGRYQTREGLNDVALVDLVLEGPNDLDPFLEFTYQPEELLAFFREHEPELRAEFRRRRLPGRPWVLRAYRGLIPRSSPHGPAARPRGRR